MNRLSSIFYYFLNAKKRHGVHSPYIFSLTDSGFSISLNENERKKLAQYRKFLQNNPTILKIEDFGAGSKKQGKRRTIQKIFNVSSTTKKYGKLLFQLSRYIQAKNILELGTNLAWGTYHLHLGSPSAQITSIEGAKSIYDFNDKNFPKIENINFVNALFDDYIETLKDEKFDLIFIDGNHKGEALMRYFKNLEKHSHNETIWILDDIRWSDDMWQAWQKIIQNQNYHVSIDLLRMGIVVGRSQQQKEHFFIRH